MSFPYKNPISSIQLNGTQSVPRNNTYGTTFSVNNTGGYMEVYSLSDLYYTIPSGTTGSIEYSGNTIPIEFTKGTGAVWSPDVLTLASDNISSGRRRLGMLVYVYEQDQVYQYYINNYETLFNAATASTGCVRISDFGTTINNKTAAGQSFINAWTGNTIEDVSGATHATAVWRKFSSGASSGGTSGTSLYIVGAGVNSTVRCGVNNTAKGDYGASLGGSGNTALGKYSFVGGGRGNTASNAYSTVGGGYSNTAIGDDSTVSGGQSNNSSGCRSTVSGGYLNTSSNYYSTVSGGRNNTSSGNGSTVSGGYCNTSSGTTSTISGGYCNINGGDSAFIGAGRCNTMVGITGGIIGGGSTNTVSNNYSVIGGGAGNTVSGYISFVGGGSSNTVSGDYSNVGGGRFNTASGYKSTISGGYCNSASGNYSFIGGGSTNTSSGYYSFIGGGYQNTISSYPSTGPSFSSILNGSLNTISGTSKIGSYSVIIGGSNNFVSDSFIGVFGCNIVASCPNTFYTNNFCSCGSIYSSTLSSGQAVCTGTNGLLTNYTPVSSVIIQGTCTTSSVRCGVSNNATADFSASLAGTGNTASGLASVVVGGALNNTYSTYSFVGGGVGNKSCGSSASVVGGGLNTSCCSYSFIGGGLQNITSGSTSSVVGGCKNTAGGNCSFIGGGTLNIITSGGSSSFIGTGRGNTVSGNYSMVLGGSGNTVTGSFSSAIGCGLNATDNCTLYTNNIITGTISATTYNNLPSFSGGSITGLTINGNLTVTGNTSLQALTATTISATTYSNLPTDIRTTGGTYSNNTFTFTNNTGGTYSVLFNTVTGLTINGNLTVTGNTSLQALTATTISATTYNNLPSFSGGTITGLTINGNLTVTGNTSLQALTATTISATTISSPFTTGSVIFQGSGGTLTQSNSQLFWDNTNNRLAIGNNAPNYPITITRNTTNNYIELIGNTNKGLFANGSGLIAFDTTGNFNIYTGGVNYRAMFSSTGNLLLNTPTDAGYLLDVNGTSRLNGLSSINGTGITNTALAIYANGVGAGNYIFQGLDSSSVQRSYLTATGNFRLNAATDTGTSGTDEKIRSLYNFSPTSGNREHYGFYMTQTINQTSGASGITRAIYIVPTLTSAYDYRTIEWTNTTGYGLYGSGSAPNYLQGNTLIGTTANTGTYKLDVRGATRLSATTGTSLTVISSGNSTSVPVFSVQGSQGELFSVTDSLTGSLFSVSDISGLPIMEVFSDSTTVIGDYQAPSLYTTKRVSSITASTGTTIYSFPTSAYTSSYVDYNVSGSTGLRAGNIMAIWSGTSVNFTETSTNDIGVTTPLTFGYVMSGSNAVLQASASTSTWIVKTIVRGL